METVLITGANRGLGFETAKQLARKGYKIYMGCRDQEKGRLAAKILCSEGGDVIPVKLDVTKTQDIRDFLNLLKENKDHIDILINNAGVFLESNSVENNASLFKVDPVIILKTIEANTLGPLKLIQSLVPSMQEIGKGRVINVSSGMGQLSDMQGGFPGYRMSKTALNALTCITNSEVDESAIAINSVCPGWVQTDMGGPNATKTLAQGVETIIWLATCENPPRGKFIQDKKVIDW